METLQIKNHPAIIKGYVERGDVVTSSDGVQRIKYVIHHSKDYSVEIPSDKEQEFLDEEDRYGTKMAASKARLEAAQAKYAAENAEKDRIKAEKKVAKAALLPPPPKENVEVRKIFDHVLEGMKKDAEARLTAHYEELVEQAKELVGTSFQNHYRLILKKWGAHVQGYDLPNDDTDFIDSLVSYDNQCEPVIMKSADKIKQRIEKVVADEVKAMFESFIIKQTAKIDGIIKGRGVHVKSRVCTNLEGWFAFELADGSKFDMQTQIVWKYSPKGKRYWQFPTTFHDATKADGTIIKNPSEAKLKEEL